MSLTTHAEEIGPLIDVMVYRSNIILRPLTVTRHIDPVKDPENFMPLLIHRECKKTMFPNRRVIFSKLSIGLRSFFGRIVFNFSQTTHKKTDSLLI